MFSNSNMKSIVDNFM